LIIYDLNEHFFSLKFQYINNLLQFNGYNRRNSYLKLFKLDIFVFPIVLFCFWVSRCSWHICLHLFFFTKSSSIVREPIIANVYAGSAKMNCLSYAALFHGIQPPFSYSFVLKWNLIQVELHIRLNSYSSERC
jgi:hypothetical protein